MSEKMSREQVNKEKPSSERLQEVLARLTSDQLRFIVARQEFSTDKAAAEEISVKPNTISQWKYEGAPIDDAVRLMALDGVVMAVELRRRNLAKAMAVKVAGLNSDDGRLRQSVATEVIEWEMGRATQPIDQNQTGELVVRVIGGFVSQPTDST